jgi:hypothetical protein
LHEIGGSRWEEECFGEMEPDLLALNSELEAGLEGFGRSHRVRSASHLCHLWKRQTCWRSLGFCLFSCSHDCCALASCELSRNNSSHRDRHSVFQVQHGAKRTRLGLVSKPMLFCGRLIWIQPDLVIIARHVPSIIATHRDQVRVQRIV